MKRTIYTTALLLVLSASSGCMTAGGLNKVVSALGKDPATVNIRITSVWGVITISRTNPSTNAVTHSVSTDGTITITAKEK